MIEIFRNMTLFLFWLFAFGVMLVIDTIGIILFCYFAKQFGEEWAEAAYRGKKRNASHKTKQSERL